MKSLIIDAQIAGASGDMFLSALLALYQADEKKTVADKKRQQLIDDLATKIIQAADLQDEATIIVKIQHKNLHAIEGINLQIKLSEPHRHLKIPQVFSIIDKFFKLQQLSEKAQTFSKKAFEILFEAEAKAHGESLDNVHLHEAGSLDTFLDVLGAAVLLDQLGLFDAFIYLLPVAIGSGTVTFSHGTLPVPAPAVVEIVKGYQIPVYSGSIKSELLTPTGAILIASLMNTCKNSVVKNYPYITIEKSVAGFGTKEFEKTPNALRLILGSNLESEHPQEEISIIETNLDDCSGETIGFLSQKLLEMGAKDVYLTPIYMKKGRPGTMISVLCLPKDVGIFAAEIMNQTSTIGVRIINSNKIMLRREIKELQIKVKEKNFKIRAKISYNEKGEIAHFKPEFDDIKHITEQTGLTINDVVSIAREEIKKKL
ncbi:MAG: nickel pincer cofactor biosynthesis protein LarC [Candidatus Heimdallarchaeota archaeon]|nr:nickel pincer cofactor biosynthesis protein LarC [Candidatus Heimdallarchaeota archaeon]MBY8995689.1 nickel pincer cofactor biosynthesis protein LarC [Candidatus Heimdallarchaeota archaeon]